MILAAVLQAIGLFIATNIDDIIVLSLFFARGAGQRRTTTRILVGQYVGFACILGAAVLVTIGAGAFLPSAAIPYFGLIPWPSVSGLHGKPGAETMTTMTPRSRARRSARGPSQESPSPTAETTSASMSPSSSAWNPSQWSPTCRRLLALVAVLVVVAKFVCHPVPIAEVLERWEHILFPIVLIGLSIVILVSGGAFGL